MHSRLRAAQAASALLPPLVAQRVRNVVYPPSLATREHQTVAKKAITGGTLVVPAYDFHGYPYAVQGYYDVRNIAIAAVVAGPGDTIVEVGANIGTETVSYADIVGGRGSVIAIEPHDPNADALRQLASLRPEIRVVHAAAGAAAGSASFVPPLEHHSGIGYVASDGEKAVTVTTVDNEVATETRVAAIFSDTEGFEIQVLQGARRTIELTRPVIVVEANEGHLRRAGGSVSELKSLLCKTDYDVWMISRFGLSETLSKGNWLCIPRENQECVSQQFVSRIRSALRGALLLPPALSRPFRQVRKRRLSTT